MFNPYIESLKYNTLILFLTNLHDVMNFIIKACLSDFENNSQL